MMKDLKSCIEFLQQLIQTRSFSFQERKLADLLRSRMEKLGFDEAWIDPAGNVIGRVRGRGEAPPLHFNTHLDHVDEGDPDDWPYPPYEGVSAEGRIWGRGAVDIKGPLACQVSAVGSILREGIRPPGDLYVTAVVQEELGGVGAQYLVKHLDTPLVVVGEPSRNELRIGHRGRVEIEVVFQGRSAHASMPHLGANPLFPTARFIDRLRQLEMQEDPMLGKASVEPTLLKTDQTCTNVIPGEVRLVCDWRTVADQTAEEVSGILRELAGECSAEGIKPSIIVPVYDQPTYTGLHFPATAEHPSYSIPVDDGMVRTAMDILNRSIGLQSEPKVWRFATDGGHFARAGWKVIGFGPGDDRLAHTVRESIEIDALRDALTGYRALALELACKTGRER